MSRGSDGGDRPERLANRERAVAERRGALSARKRAAVDRLLQGDAARRETCIPRSNAPPGTPQALSFAQERLWFLDQLEPGGAAYNLPAAVRLTGRLDRGALGRALEAVAARHETLRTSFAAGAAGTRQIASPPGTSPLPLIDLAALPDTARAAEADRQSAAEAARPFDLATGPPVRALLLREGEERHDLLLTMHHIAADGWSMGILVSELAAFYGASLEGLPPGAAGLPGLPALPITYADFAAFQRQRLAGEALHEDLAWWRQRLAGAPAELELPFDRPRSAGSSESPAGRGGQRDLVLPPALGEALSQRAREAGATPFMALLAVFAALLARWTGSADVVVGTPVAGRDRVETEGLIGFFVNTLPLRVDLGGELTFAALLDQAREATLAAWAHQEVPFERLVQELAPERIRGRTPLFQVALVLQNAPRERVSLPGLTIERLPAATGGALFDLTLNLAAETAAEGFGLAGVLEYSRALFDGATAARLGEHFLRLAAGAVARPAAPLAALPLLGEAERAQLRDEWGRSRSAYPRDATVHELFFAWAERAPDAVALTTDDAALSYGALARRARRLARGLQRLGVGPEVPVALHLPRSPGLITALLGVLAAGGAYVPLDSGSPPERLGHTLADVAAASGGRALLLAERGRLDEVAWAGPEVRIVALEDALAAGDSDGEPEGGALPRTAAESLAYVLYTSGSTGRPKGVAAVHRGIVRLVRGNTYARCGPREVFLQLAPASFDASTFEIWGALANGSRLVLAPPGVPTTAELESLLARHGVTTLWLTAGLFHRVVEDDAGALAPLSQLLAGGEALSVPHVERALAALPRTRLVDGYGPTEGTTFTCCWPIAAPIRGAAIPIGRPIANTDALVLDRSDRHGTGAELAPLGIPGELVAAGDGLARGYFQRPDLTAERFRPHPHPESPGERCYHTGDLVRTRADGRLEFLGRADRQVKIRGFRIEPGEVEAALAAHPRLGAAAVVPWEPRPGELALAAYVVPREGEEPPPAGELAAFLRGRLPEFMLPATFISLPQLPLNANGKLDRAALPPPAPQRDEEEELRGEAAPAGPIEELLAGIWCQVLGVPRVAATDDFFALGGHSLLATRVASRIREVFGLELPVRALFDAPRLGELARDLRNLLERAERPAAGAAAPPLRRGARDGPLPLSFAQERLWFLDRLEPGSTAYNLSLPLALDGALDVAALAASLAELARRHEALRTRFPEEEDGPRQAIAGPEALGELAAAPPLIDLAALPERARESTLADLLAAAGRRPFDLARGPLVRSLLLRRSERQHALLIVQHHIVTDGWSLGILVRELAALYRAAVERRPARLAEPAVQYADYALWQRELLAGDTLATQLDYWRGVLGGELPVLSLPTDRQRRAVSRGRGASAALTLDAALSTAVAGLARSAGATLFMTLLAAFDVVLQRQSGSDDLLVGVPIAGRARAEVEGTLGFFVNTLVLRADLAGNPTFASLLARIREVALGAYAHQDLPFERLVAELQPRRDLARAPLFQVFFNQLNFSPTGLGGAAGRPLELPGLTVERLAGPALAPPPAKFDLTVYASEEAGRLRLDLLYDADLFDRARIEETLAQLAAVLAAAVENPERKIDGISLLTPRASALLPDPRAPQPAAGGPDIPALFAARAAAAPDRIAIVDEAGLLTYGFLAGRVQAIAGALRRSGLEPGQVVAVHARRDASLAAALLGVLAAGGAFLVLDPAHPPARLAAHLRRAAPQALIDLQPPPAELPLELAAVLAELSPLLRCRLSPPLRCRLGRHVEDRAEAQAPVASDLDRTAYVVFTSGSTGEPKGVVGTQRPLVHFLRWHIATSALGPDDRFSLLSGLAHDPLLRDLFTPLTSGATLCIPTADLRDDPAGLRAWLAAEGVSVVHLTPALGRLLAQEAPPARLPALRHAFFGGDRLTAGDVARLTALAPRVASVNFYGATETPQAMGWHRGASTAGDPSTALPLGEGIEGVQLLVLGRHGTLAGIGELGEIHVRTPYLARGYLGDEALTRERFLVDPAEGGDRRLYRTGDLGRYRPDGAVELAGRADDQVKVRGYRVEPAEVEAVLVRHPAVAAAAVLAIPLPGEGGEMSLLACWVAARGEPPPVPVTARELLDHLRQELPPALLPRAFVRVPELPRTPNGKLDRRRLAEIAADASTANESANESAGTSRLETAGTPSDPLTELLGGIWTEVLGVERTGGRPGPDDDFFALGGHSLLATRVLSRVREALGVEVPVRRLFESPTLAGLARAVAVAREGAHGVPAVSPHEVPAVSRRDPGTEPPASFSQERLWFLDRLQPGDAAYHMPAALRLAGPLDPRALAAALAEIVRRHEALRTVFADRDERTVQIVLGSPSAAGILPAIDVAALPADRREAEALALARREGLLPFDLARGPLHRFRLVRLGDEDHLLLATLHHIVSDGWSMGVLVAELVALYGAFAAGRPSPLPELPVQYGDFALWQRRWQGGEALAAPLAWWRQRLAGAPPLLALPTDRPRPPIRGSAGVRLPWRPSAELGDRLGAFARRLGATLFMVVLAGFEALLARWSGQEDLVVGTPIANRPRRELEGLIGFFANTLALRGDLAGDPPWAEMVARCRETALDAYAHQDLPFERLVAELNPERSLAHTPLFQVLLVLQNAPLGAIALPGLALVPFEPAAATARFDWTLALAGTGDSPIGIAGHLEYATDLFDGVTAHRALGHLEALLAGAVEAPGTLLSDLPLLSAAERQAFAEWNDTGAARAARPAASLHGLIVAQAERTPEAVAVAVAGEEGCLSYGALLARSEILARRLRAAGVGPETRVGLLAERSLALMVGLVAVLRAGGAYVPLDPEAPPERLGWMVGDSGVALVLAQDRFAGRLPAESARVVSLDGPSSSGGRRSAATGLPAAIEPDALAYVIYTSGSTGRPKGAMNTHRGIVNRLLWMQETFRLEGSDRVLQKTPTGFDVSVWELFWPLIGGARLVMAQPGGHRDGEYLRDVIAEEEITTLHFVPPMLAAFLETPGVERCPSLRRVMASGEALGVEAVERWYRKVGAPLHNLYGPTEAAVDVTWWRCFPGAGTMPIGRPIANTTVEFLGKRGEVVPIGAVGELAIGGVQLARGYLGRPELTAERFVPHPAGGPGERLYRTGDLARLRRDGAIEYLGRLDHQVKIRGVRVEPGEIEAALLGHPGVCRAVVVAREDRPGERRLVAYLVPKEAGAVDLTTVELRGYLGARLPEALVPAAFVVLVDLPLTANGKLDRRALPPPEAGSSLERRYTPPRTPAERVLAQIWAGLLGLEKVGVEENFFELGGDSISGLQMVSRSARAGLRLTPRGLFQHQTIARLAPVATNIATNRDRTSIDVEADLDGPVPLTPIQRWLLDQDLANPNHFNQALLLTLRRPVPAAVLAAALEKLVDRHDALRLRFRQMPAGWEQTVAPRSRRLFLLMRIDLAALPAELRGPALTAAAGAVQTALDLERGPTFRAALFELGAPAGQRLLLAAHHLAVDGVSWRILLEELAEGCAAPAADPPSAALPFASWARRLEGYARSGAVDAELPFWLGDEFRNAVPFPADFASPAEPGLWADARTHAVELAPEETAALLHDLATIGRAGVDEALLAALGLACGSFLSGLGTVLVDVEGHGREAIADDLNDLDMLDMSRTVGWFTRLVPLALPPGSAGPSGALRLVKERLRALPSHGIAHSLGHGLLLHLRGGEGAAALAALPRPQILFNYLGRLDQALPPDSLFAPAPEAIGPSVDPRNRRSHPLQVSAGIAGGKLSIAWTYGRHGHRRETIERLAAAHLAALRGLLAHVREAAARGEIASSPADFPAAGLDAPALDRLLRGLGAVEDVYPLSPLQEGMLFHSRLAADPELYLTQYACTLHGPLDEAAFESAWQQVAARHSILRSGFHAQGLARPLQVVLREAGAPWERLDWSGIWSGLDRAEQGRRRDDLLAADRRRGFELARAPLQRFTLVRLGPAERLLVWSFHHLLLDGWSLPLVFAEVFALYTRRRGSPGLPPARPYRDYILWLEGRDPAAAEPFWRRELAGFTAPTPLGIDRGTAEGPARGEPYERRHLFLSAAETAALQGLARRGRLTLSTLLQGAWALALGRYSGEEDVLFGATSAGRPPELSGIESRVGVFINTLPVRAGVAPGSPLLPWLAALFESQSRAREHEHTPLTRIQSWSELPRGTPLFESLLVFENYPVDPLDPVGPNGAAAPGGLRIGEVQTAQRTHYPLTLVAAVQGDRLRLRFAYDGRRFDGAAIVRALRHLASLLRGFAAAPARPLGEIPMLDPGERQALIHEWSAAAHNPGADGADRLAHRLFEERAREMPDAAALLFEDAVLTYAELDARAGRLAGRLRRAGIGPERLAALAIRRSLELPQAILAVWKAGGAYLPLDTAYPHERLAFMLADSGARALVAGADLDASLLAGLAQEGDDGRLTVLQLDHRGDLSDLNGKTETPAPSHGLADGEPSTAGLAYLLYTSGSTGQPKGVEVAHRGLAALVRAQIASFGIAPGDRVLQLASASFDASVSELLTALSAGAALVLLRDTAVAPGSGLVRRLREAEVTVATFPPSLLAALPAAELPALATLVVAGEACPADLAERWAHGRRLLNAYGPTEATVCATIERWDGGPGAPPLGHPIAGTRLHLLDRQLAPVPGGVAGEIHLGGPGLARGYGGRPDLTAERFVPDPFAAVAGERLYRTGDLARRRWDGRLDFLGRADRQVKVRGFRIEVGEVEASLRRHPAIADCAVGARPDAMGALRLVAWIVPAAVVPEAVVPEALGTIDPQALRSFLAATLPDNLVPSLFLPLADLPRTPAGKLDRRALPAPALAERDDDLPATPFERFLAGLWGEVLGLGSVGRGQGFFALGGDSLKAAILLDRLEAALGGPVYVTVLYDEPTLAALALRLGREHAGAVARLFGAESLPPAAEARASSRLDEAAIESVRRAIPPPLTRPRQSTPKNPPAVFVLSPPRSGSTLLRVLLGGHPRLFAPPELDLLSFDTLGERRAAFTGKYAFWREGAVRAVMAAQGCGAEEATRRLEQAEAEDLPVGELYARLQTWIGDRLLVDKTPAYALDERILARAEERFDGARYLHLVRHPLGMMRSFEEARIDQLFFRWPHELAPRRLGEAIWVLSHRNVLRFLASVPAERHHRVVFEDLVRDPGLVLQGICAFLGLDLDPAMLQPYESRQARMTDGIHPLSKMLGDVKFHQHEAIDPDVAERWREELGEDELGEPTRELARRLGYELAESRLPDPGAIAAQEPRPATPSRTKPVNPPLVALQPRGDGAPLFCVHPLGGGVHCYAALARELGGERPLYALEARGLRAGEEPQTDLEEMAACYLAAIRRRQPAGPLLLVGWSFGGLLAFAMARRAADRGEPVGLLALLDVPARLLEAPGRLDDAELLAGAFEGLLPVAAADLRKLPDDERLPHLLAEAERRETLPAGLDLAHARRLHAVAQASRRALAAYQPGVYPGRATLVRTAEPTAASEAPDRALGWDRWIAGGVDVHQLPGGHLDLLRPPNVARLAALLRTAIGQALAQTTL